MRCWRQTPPSPRQNVPETQHRARRSLAFAEAPTRAFAMDCGRFRARLVDPVRETVRGPRDASSTTHCKQGAPVRECAPEDLGTVEQGLKSQPSILAPHLVAGSLRSPSDAIVPP